MTQGVDAPRRRREASWRRGIDSRRRGVDRRRRGEDARRRGTEEKDARRQRAELYEAVYSRLLYQTFIVAGGSISIEVAASLSAADEFHERVCVDLVNNKLGEECDLHSKNRRPKAFAEVTVLEGKRTR